MALWIIVVILLVGLALIFLEVFFIPGTTVFGILGGVAMAAGIGLMYGYYGSQYGNPTLIASLVAAVAVIIAGFKVIGSNKLAMKGEITGKVNTLEVSLQVGDKGSAVTELRPNGKAMFNGNKIEVFSLGEYIQRDTPLEVIKVTTDKIFVKPLNV